MFLSNYVAKSEKLCIFAPRKRSPYLCTRCSGFRLVLRGCNANNGSNAGLADVNVNNDVSNSNANIGSPLNFTMVMRDGASPQGEK